MIHLFFQVLAAASSHAHKYSNVSNQDSEASQEPIYQNQSELRKQLIDKREPIYQNLPAHEKMMLLQQKKLQEVKQNLDEEQSEDISSTVSGNNSSKIKGHVSRVAITNSREDLSSQHLEYISQNTSPNSRSQVDESADRKKSVTKINIGTPKGDLNMHEVPQKPQQVKAQPSNVQANTKAIVENHQKIPEKVPTKSSNHVQKSPPKKPARAKASQSVENITTIADETTLLDETVNSGHLTPTTSKANTIHTPRTPSSKPRAGRKRWAFNFGGSKTGSLKSLKSVKSTGEEDEDKK